MQNIDWSSVAMAAFLLVVSTRLSIVAIRFPDPNDDVPDFLPPEGEGALAMLVLAIGALVIAVKSEPATLVDRAVAGAYVLSSANALLVACVLFRNHRIKTATKRSFRG